MHVNRSRVGASYASVLIDGDVRQPRPPLPLEILPAGEFDPLYRLPLDVQGGELPVLPLSIPGAVSFARAEGVGDGFLSGTEWFLFKFDKQQAGLSGGCDKSPSRPLSLPPPTTTPTYT